MNKEIYQSMITGLLMTLLEKEVVLGEVDAQEDVLKIVDMVEDLERFWNSSSEFDSNSDNLHGYMQEIRRQYSANDGQDGKGKIMDRFFTQRLCDRCRGSLKEGRTMSVFNTDCICLACKEKEMARSDYDEAVKAEQEEIRKGNYNFKGIKS